MPCHGEHPHPRTYPGLSCLLPLQHHQPLVSLRQDSIFYLCVPRMLVIYLSCCALRNTCSHGRLRQLTQALDGQRAEHKAHKNLVLCKDQATLRGPSQTAMKECHILPISKAMVRSAPHSGMIAQGSATWVRSHMLSVLITQGWHMKQRIHASSHTCINSVASLWFSISMSVAITL